MRIRIIVLIGVVVAAVIALGILFLCFRFISGPEPLPTRAFDLPEIGMRIAVTDTLADLVYEPRSAPRLGTMLHMQATSILSSDGAPCELGVYYTLPKGAVEVAGTLWSEERLRAATVRTEDTPPQVKEFASIYLVYEPSQAACTRDPALVAREAAKRAALWEAIRGATELRLR
jgi:hypothetical protein